MARPQEQGREIVLLVGAGGSSYIGVPPMKPFLQSLYGALKEAARDDLADLARTILRYSSRYPDLETLMIEADALKSLGSSVASRTMLDLMPKRRGGALTKEVKEQIRRRRRLVDQLWTRLLNHIRQTCVSFDKERAKELYGPLLALNRITRLRIFTTNYDPIIEDTCETMGIRFSENFQREGNRFFFDPTYSHLGKSDVDIVKLHGSVWWYRIPDLGKIERAPYLLRDVSREGLRVEQLMIIPSAFKDIYGDPFFGLYLDFLHSMENARVCVVIGHSLRDEYLTGIIETRLMDPDFHLVVVCPQPNPKDKSKVKLRSILGKRRVIHIPFRFENFYRELTSFLEDYVARPEGALPQLRAVIREKKRYQRSKKAILRVSGVPETVQRGSEIVVTVTYKGELRRAYLAARLLTRGPRTIASEVAPGTYDSKGKIGLLDGAVVHENSWSLTIPSDLTPGRYSIQVVVLEPYLVDEELMEREIKQRRISLTVT